MAFFRDRAWPFFLSLAVHAAIVGALIYGVVWFSSDPKPQPPPQLAIEAQVVDERRVQQEMQQIQEEEDRKKRELREQEERAEQLKRERESEEQRLEEVRKQRVEEEEAERKRAEEKAAEAARVAQQEAKKKSAAAAEKKRKDEAARKKAAEESKLKAEREAELKRRLEAEEQRSAAVNAGLLSQYLAQIQARIQRAWIRPPSARAGLNCVVYVTQVPSGEVVSVRIGECNGDDIVRQSIEAAVYRASPLPLPSDPTLFERNLRLNFKPDE